MKLKQKPSEPVRRKDITRTISGIGDTVQDLLDSLPTGIPYNKILIEIDGYDAYPYLEYKTDETDEEFNKRLEHYKIKKAEYDEWYNTNKEEIDKALLAKKQKREQKEQRQLETKRKALLNAKASIEKELASLEKQEKK